MATDLKLPARPKRLLPIGIQDFPDIRERGFVYVDKTARARELITGSGKAFFLSRPRRFGKSLTKRDVHIELRDALQDRLTDAIYAGDVDAALNAVKLFLAELPYDMILEKEVHYQTLLRVIFKMLGFCCRTEERIAPGRIDMLVTTPDFVYCFEFKLSGSAEKALAQIDTKEYAFPWTGSAKKVFKVGVGFDKKKRNVWKWAWAACG